MAIRHLGTARKIPVASADGTELHVEVRGPESGPTVVLSHCWATSLASWGPVVRLLDGNLRVVLYDQRGHGRTPVPLTPAGYGPEKLADDLCAVLEATVPAGERAVVAGHSMGGMTIMAAGDREVFRDRAAAVVLTNTGCTQLAGRSTAFPVPAAAVRSAASALTLRAPLPLGPRNRLTAQALKFIAMSPGADPRMVRLCARMVHACDPVARGRWGDMITRLDLDATVRAISAPTVVLVGTADRMTPPWHARHVASLVRDCTEVVEVPGAGHMGPLEFPDVLADRIGKLAADHLGAALSE